MALNIKDPDYAVLSIEPQPLAFDEGAAIGTAYNLWQQWCGDGDAPPWSAVELFNLPPDLLPNTVVVDVIDGGKDYRYRFWGTGYSGNYGIDETGQLLSESLGVSFIAATFEQLQKVLDARAPQLFDVTIKTPQSGLIQKKLNLRMPIADDDGNIDKILTVSEFGRLTHQDAERLKASIEADKKRLDGDT